MKIMKRINLVILILSVFLFSCGKGKSTNGTNEEKQTAPKAQAYKGAEVAYVKEGKLYFYYPKTKENKQFSEEKEPVFNCVFDNTSDIIYYTVERDSTLWLKKASYSKIPVQITEIGNTKVKKEKCITDTYGEKSILLFTRGESVIKYFNKFIDRYEIEGCKAVKNELMYKNCNLSNTLGLEVGEYMKEQGETSIDFSDFKFSTDKSKLLFGAMTDMGDLAHGPFCIANTDGSHQQILMEDGLSSDFKPFWVGNQAVFWRHIEDKNDGNEDAVYYKQLYITNPANNSSMPIVKDLDYYTVRELPPQN